MRTSSRAVERREDRVDLMYALNRRSGCRGLPANNLRPLVPAPRPSPLLTFDQASALAFSWSNSACVIDPLSSNAFAEEIWSAGLDELATDLMY